MARGRTTRGAREGRHQQPYLRLPGSHALCAASRAADLRHVSPARRGGPCRGTTGCWTWVPAAGSMAFSPRARADVLALDANPGAVWAAQDNARHNEVADRLEVRLSDVFDAVDPAADGPFDVVVFDPHFRWFQPRYLLEMATADPGYRALTRVRARGTAAPVRPRSAAGVLRQLQRPRLFAMTGCREEV